MTDTASQAPDNAHPDHPHHHPPEHAQQHSGQHPHGDHVHRGGVRGILDEVLRPHSHDAAGSIDDALQTSRHGIRAVKVSLVLLAVTAGLQVLVVAKSGSVALLADTAHNLTDALTALPLWLAFALGLRPPTRRHTYGFGRAEDLAGLFVLAMIALSAVVTGYQSVDKLIHPQPPQYLGWVAGAGLVGFVGNQLVAVYRIRVGRMIGSAALIADGQHARTDALTSLAVVLGAAAVAVGWPLADPLIGLGITAVIVGVLIQATGPVLARLMDAVDPALVSLAEQTLAATEHVDEVPMVRLRWVGHRLQAEADVTTEATQLAEASAVATAAQSRLLATIPRLAQARVRVLPRSIRGR